MEGLQFMQLNTQELHNVWRKQALRDLMVDVLNNSPEGGLDEMNSRTAEHVRCRIERFMGENGQHLSDCVHQFREPVNFDVDINVPEVAL